MILLCVYFLSVCHVSVVKIHYLSDGPSFSIVGFLRGIGIKIEGRGVDFERGVLTSFCSMNYHDDKMYNTAVPPKYYYYYIKRI